MSRTRVPDGIPTWDPCDFVRGAHTGPVCGYPPGNPQVSRRVTPTGPSYAMYMRVPDGIPTWVPHDFVRGARTGPVCGYPPGNPQVTHRVTGNPQGSQPEIQLDPTSVPGVNPI